MEILYNYYYEHPSDKENNYSVCLLFRHGDKQFLFTGDLEKKGEEYLAEKYNFTQVDLFKAGHHGSITSSNEVLLNEIQPAICVVTCSAGENTYGAAQENIFPSQEFINRISEWTESVYVTTLGDDDFTGDKDFMDMNGNVIISSTEKGIQVICSNNSTLLKDTEWFKARRTTPPKWQ